MHPTTVTYWHPGLEFWCGQNRDFPSGLPKLPLQALLHWHQQVVVGIAFIFEGEASIADMIQILQPLKEGDGHTTCIYVQILSQRDKLLLPFPGQFIKTCKPLIGTIWGCYGNYTLSGNIPIYDNYELLVQPPNMHRLFSNRIRWKPAHLVQCKYLIAVDRLCI